MTRRRHALRLAALTAAAALALAACGSDSDGGGSDAGGGTRSSLVNSRIDHTGSIHAQRAARSGEVA